MIALASGRLFLFAGELFPYRKLPQVCRSTWFHSGVFLKKPEQIHEPLTLANLGYKSEFLEAGMSKVNKVAKLDSPKDISKSRVKAVRNSEKRAEVTELDSPRDISKIRVKAVRNSENRTEVTELDSPRYISRSRAKAVRNSEKKVEVTGFDSPRNISTSRVKTVWNSEKKAEVTELDSPRDITKSRVKTVRSSENKVVGARKLLETEMAPFAAKSFSELGLPASLIERLESEGIRVPTDIQSASIPTILKKNDVVIQSYTGSGKTLAYVLPILSEIGPFKNTAPNGNDEFGKKKDIEAVIVAPSRELGMQIVREIEKVLGPTHRKVVQQLVGGANRSRQEEALKKNKPAIVVGTPGRIAEISAAGKLHTHGCSYLILDEVDELLSFHFREDMHRILEHVGRRSGADPQGSKNAPARRAERRLVMVSATVPFSVVRAAHSWGCDPLLVKANKVTPLESVTPSGPIHLRGPSSVSTSNSTLQGQTAAIDTLPPSLKHYYCVSRLQHKVDTLRRCVHALDAQSVMVFMNQIKQIKDVVFKLKARGINAAELHGDLGKLERSTTLKSFKNGEIRVLVTNELSARGLDIAECELVVNLDLPTDSIHYAHRAGRTGRLGRMGTVVSICEEPEEFVVKKLQKQLGVPISACEFTEGKLVNVDEEGD